MKSEAVLYPERSSGLSFIEHLQIICQNECSNPNRIWVLGRDTETKQMLWTRPPCKLWKCPECAARNGRRFVAIIIHGVNEIGGSWYMFTVTAHRRWRGVNSIKNLRFGWTKLYGKMAYHFGKMTYAKIFDLHKDDSYHIHGLINKDIPSSWLRDKSVESAMGYETEIHQIDNAGQAGGYAAKYSIKAAGNAERWLPNVRRIQLSHNWPRQENPFVNDNFIWTRHSAKSKIEIAISNWQKRGYALIS